jgi:hypothetical protein
MDDSPEVARRASHRNPPISSSVGPNPTSSSVSNDGAVVSGFAFTVTCSASSALSRSSFAYDGRCVWNSVDRSADPLG